MSLRRRTTLGLLWASLLATLAAWRVSWQAGWIENPASVIHGVTLPAERQALHTTARGSTKESGEVGKNEVNYVEDRSGAVFNGKGIVESAADAQEELEGRVKGTDQVHITHVFNAFGSDKESLLAKEHAVVLRSWRVAMEYAASQGVRVELVAAVLPEDAAAAPSEAIEVYLDDFIEDPFTGHHLPAVGDVFRAGKEHGKGEYLIYTNADIGVVEDFYTQVWELAHLDTSENEFQIDLIKRAFELLRYCLEFREDGQGSAVELCQADTKEYFKLHGGAQSLWKETKRMLARAFVKYKALGWSLQPSRAKLVEWYKKAGGLSENAEEDLVNLQFIKAFEIVPVASNQKLISPTAFTITRMDLSGVDQFKAMSLEEISNLDVKAFLSHSERQAHPGNDCFVMPRRMVPEMLMQSKHPLGWRPWGMWMPPTFEWEFGSGGLIWRRFEGTMEHMYTFHLGVSGRVTDNWAALFQARPDFVMGLAANWNQVTGGRFLQLFDVPTFCRQTKYYRHAKFCQNGPATTMQYCQGNVHYSCARYQYARLRDGNNYVTACERMIRNSVASDSQFMVPPFCSFCSGMMQYYGRPTTKAKAALDMCDTSKRLVSCGTQHCEFQSV